MVVPQFPAGGTPTCTSAIYQDYTYHYALRQSPHYSCDPFDFD